MKEADCLPCPMCGGHAQIFSGKMIKRLIQDEHSPEEERIQPCSVRCVDCGASIGRAACHADHGGANGAQQEARRLAVAAWNTRDQNNAKQMSQEQFKAHHTENFDCDVPRL